MKTITLSRPVEHEGKLYTEITIDEPTLGAVEAYQNAIKDGNEVSGTIAMISYDTGLPVDMIRKIRSSDFQKLSEALNPLDEAAGSNGEA